MTPGRPASSRRCTGAGSASLVISPRWPVSAPRLASPTSPPLLAGRARELDALHRALATALTGVRQLLFVTGEAGLGKTTLVEAFLTALEAYGPLWIGRGQCLDHYGAGEAYLPVLEALGRLCRGPGGQEVVALLEQQAPTWLVQMPGLVRPPTWRHYSAAWRVRPGTGCCGNWRRPSSY